MAPPIAPTSPDAQDAALERLDAARPRFVALSLDQRIRFLEQAIDGMLAVKADWVEASCRAKGIAPGSHSEGEEWLGGPMTTIRNLRLLKETLEDIRDHGSPQLPKNAVSVGSNGQTTVRVFPSGIYDQVLFGGFTADVRLQEGITPQNLRDHMAVVYKPGGMGNSRVALVLGGGNVSSIGPMDVLYKLFVDGEVCLLKMHPVNEYTGPLLERAFRHLIEADFLKVVYGGADVGDRLCKHALVGSIHITGSDRTHDIIVWGPPGKARDNRQKKGKPLNDKPISSELGNVSPVVVVPGPWTEADLRFQAENIATMVANNASFNCNAAKLVVLSDGWPLGDRLMAEVEKVLRRIPPRKAYYPGAQDRYQQFLDAYPNARPLSARTEDVVPWTLIDVPSDAQHGGQPAPDELGLRVEPFCGVLSVARVASRGAAEFIDRIVGFCNDQVWGSLNVTLLVHPKSLADKPVERALESAIDRLKYGTVAINHWPALAYGLGYTPWGAYPGHPLDDIQSGRGVVHNTYMFDGVEKTIIRGPFRVMPKPPWFVTNKRSHAIGERLCEFEAAPSLRRLPGIVANAVVGSL